jgi:hypothetical protein
MGETCPQAIEGMTAMKWTVEFAICGSVPDIEASTQKEAYEKFNDLHDFLGTGGIAEKYGDLDVHSCLSEDQIRNAWERFRELSR